MYKLRILFKKKSTGCSFLQQLRSFRNSSYDDCVGKPTINLQKCLILSKLSRYEFERNRLSKFSEHEFEKILRNRGTDFDNLMHYHHLNKRFEKNVVGTLKNMGISVKVANRFTCTKDDIEWADIICPTGGDGTFLLASSKIRDNKKPVIGFNSDPTRSEGHLCLPKKYSTNIREAIEKLQEGSFKWLMRSRIRTTLIGRKIHETPVDLHEENCTLNSCEEESGELRRILPYLALNEVFIGECLSARVSHLEMTLNSSEIVTKTKSSGLCVSTGTGSTSWHLSMNRLPTQTVAELLRLLDLDSPNACEEGLAKRLADVYNKNLIFNADDTRMGYTIRDLISAGVWPSPKGIQPRGFASRIRVRSCCYDAGLVIDGGVSFAFNDGTEALLEIRGEDSLRTVIFEE